MFMHAQFEHNVVIAHVGMLMQNAVLTLKLVPVQRQFVEGLLLLVAESKCFVSYRLKFCCTLAWWLTLVLASNSLSTVWMCPFKEAISRGTSPYCVYECSSRMYNYCIYMCMTIGYCTNHRIHNACICESRLSVAFFFEKVISSLVLCCYIVFLFF